MSRRRQLPRSRRESPRRRDLAGRVDSQHRPATLVRINLDIPHAVAIVLGAEPRVRSLALAGARSALEPPVRAPSVIEVFLVTLAPALRALLRGSDLFVCPLANATQMVTPERSRASGFRLMLAGDVARVDLSVVTTVREAGVDVVSASKRSQERRLEAALSR